MLYRNEGIKRDTGHTVQQWSRIFFCFLIYFGLCAAAATLMGHTQHTITRTEKKEERERKKYKNQRPSITVQREAESMESLEGERSKKQSQELLLCFWFLVSFWFISAAPRSARPDLEAPLRLFAALHMKWSDWNIVSLSPLYFFVLFIPPSSIFLLFFFHLIIYFVLFCFLLTPVSCRWCCAAAAVAQPTANIV